MGDVLHKINITSPGKNTEDDEDNWVEGSGSGDWDPLTSRQTQFPQVRPSTRRPSTKDKDQDALIIYIVAAVVFIVIVVVIIVAIIFCVKKKARARAQRQKSNLGNQGSDRIMQNRETRVFGNFPVSTTMDLRRIEQERAISRSAAPPDFMAPSPPKAGAAPEAEKLLKAGRGSQDKLQPELTSLLPPESTNQYEEIHYMTAPTNNEKEDKSSKENKKPVSNPYEKINIKENTDNYEIRQIKNTPVAKVKPQKSLRNIRALEDNPIEIKKQESSV